MTLLWEIAFYLYGFAELNYLNSLRLSLSDVALTLKDFPKKEEKLTRSGQIA